MSTYKFKAIHNGQLEGSKYWPYTVSGGSNVSLIQFVNISGAPRAREARAERSTMGKKIW